MKKYFLIVATFLLLAFIGVSAQEIPVDDETQFQIFIEDGVVYDIDGNVLDINEEDLIFVKDDKQTLDGEIPEEDFSEESLESLYKNLDGEISSCYEYFNLNNVEFYINNDYISYEAGGAIVLSGTIKNNNNFPLTNVDIKASLVKVSEGSNAKLLADNFVLIDKLSVNSGSEYEISYTYTLPTEIPSGEYEILFDVVENGDTNVVMPDKVSFSVVGDDNSVLDTEYSRENNFLEKSIYFTSTERYPIKEGEDNLLITCFSNLFANSEGQSFKLETVVKDQNGKMVANSLLEGEAPFSDAIIKKFKSDKYISSYTIESNLYDNEGNMLDSFNKTYSCKDIDESLCSGALNAIQLVVILLSILLILAILIYVHKSKSKKYVLGLLLFILIIPAGSVKAEKVSASLQIPLNVPGAAVYSYSTWGTVNMTANIKKDVNLLKDGVKIGSGSEIKVGDVITLQSGSTYGDWSVDGNTHSFEDYNLKVAHQSFSQGQTNHLVSTTVFKPENENTPILVSGDNSILDCSNKISCEALKDSDGPVKVTIQFPSTTKSPKMSRDFTTRTSAFGVYNFGDKDNVVCYVLPRTRQTICNPNTNPLEIITINNSNSPAMYGSTSGFGKIDFGVYYIREYRTYTPNPITTNLSTMTYSFPDVVYNMSVGQGTTTPSVPPVTVISPTGKVTCSVAPSSLTIPLGSSSAGPVDFSVSASGGTSPYTYTWEYLTSSGNTNTYRINSITRDTNTGNTNTWTVPVEFTATDSEGDSTRTFCSVSVIDKNITDQCNNIGGDQFTVPSGTTKQPDGSCTCNNGGTPPTCEIPKGVVTLNDMVTSFYFDSNTVPKGESCPLYLTVSGVDQCELHNRIDDQSSRPFSGPDINIAGGITVPIGTHTLWCKVTSTSTPEQFTERASCYSDSDIKED